MKKLINNLEEILPSNRKSWVFLGINQPFVVDFNQAEEDYVRTLFLLFFSGYKFIHQSLNILQLYTLKPNEIQ